MVALRALTVYRKHPLVTINTTPETSKTGLQVVLFEGGIENTGLGAAMLDVDVYCKRLALGELTAEVWGVRSYLALLGDQARRGEAKDRIISRFWVSNSNPSLAIRRTEGVFAIMKLSPVIETEILYAEVGGKRVQDLGRIRDHVGNVFAGQMTDSLADLATQYQCPARIEPILATVSLAAGMIQLEAERDLGFWLASIVLPK